MAALRPTDPDAFFEETAVVGPERAGERLDRVAAEVFPDYSRSFLQKAIRDGQVTLDGERVKPRAPVHEGAVVRARLPVLGDTSLTPEPIPLDVLYEDGDLLILNKPAGMVVHPSRGQAMGTVANALLAHCRNLSDVNGPLRPGIVHRLDRDTTGALVAAKTNRAHAGLAAQFEARTVRKTYHAIVRGRMEFDEGQVDLPIGRDPRVREKMTVRRLDGRPALSRYKVIERFRRFTYVGVQIMTGRTHQIRVHLGALKHAVVADPTYGGGPPLTRSAILGRAPDPGDEPLIARQALHAYELGFRHPVTDEEMTSQAPLPEDFERALAVLREEGKG